jgi:hypothetical protein
MGGGGGAQSGGSYTARRRQADIARAAGTVGFDPNDQDGRDTTP